MALYRVFPALFKDENSVPTPTMFLPYTDKVPTLRKTLFSALKIQGLNPVAWGLYYKTFYGCDLQISVIS